MKTVRVKSNKYSKRSIQFGSFLMKFDARGIAELDVTEAEEVELNNILNLYSDSICHLDEVSSRELEAKKQGNIEYLQKIIDSQKEEIKILKIANEEMATENVQLKAELKVYREQGLINKENKKVVAEKVESKTEEQNKVLSELTKKTVDQLKEILTTTFADFKNEWSKLTIKEDIVKYIFNKYQTMAL